MKQEFQHFINSNHLHSDTHRLLLGVSGGIDSICMFHLYRELGLSIGIAHCNFQLRDSESDQDEIFVRNLANQYDIPFFTTRFDTKELAESKGISIQMAARELRYNWFEEIREKYSYDLISIAHNKDDIVETFLINLTRGSGIKGFTGIKPKTGNIIRPLLDTSRNDIAIYINKHKFKYREDSSNQSLKYSRNLIRHEIIPAFEKINPVFRETIIENISKLKDTEKIYNERIETTRLSILKIKNNRISINIQELNKLNPISTLLYELLQPYGFSGTQSLDIIESLNGISGKQFLSKTHRLVKDRNDLIIDEIKILSNENYYIDKNVESINSPISLSFSELEINSDFKIPKSKNIGLLDIDKIEFPLILRKWKKGDYFMPLGMTNIKKLSDFFIDNKLSLIDKENTWILESCNRIIWIVGQRIDERFKITNKTKTILKIELIQ